jgi:hypothetical protein
MRPDRDAVAEGILTMRSNLALHLVSRPTTLGASPLTAQQEDLVLDYVGGKEAGHAQFKPDTASAIGNMLAQFQFDPNVTQLPSAPGTQTQSATLVPWDGVSPTAAFVAASIHAQNVPGQAVLLSKAFAVSGAPGPFQFVTTSDPAFVNNSASAGGDLAVLTPLLPITTPAQPPVVPAGVAAKGTDTTGTLLLVGAAVLGIWAIASIVKGTQPPARMRMDNDGGTPGTGESDCVGCTETGVPYFLGNPSYDDNPWVRAHYSHRGRKRTRVRRHWRLPRGVHRDRLGQFLDNDGGTPGTGQSDCVGCTETGVPYFLGNPIGGFLDNPWVSSYLRRVPGKSRRVRVKRFFRKQGRLPVRDARGRFTSSAMMLAPESGPVLATPRGAEGEASPFAVGM